MRAKSTRRRRGPSSNSGSSPARGRRGEGDDRWAPPVSDSERGKRRGAGRRGGKVGCWAAAGPREGDEANQAGESEGLQRTLADGPR